MAVGKSNPLRQMMINMMYLVLTALLALNVSAEILKAFHTVNVGMRKSIDLIDAKQAQTMDQFSFLMETSPAAVKEFSDKARQVNEICDALYNDVEGLRKRVIEESGGSEIRDGDEFMLNDKDVNVVPRIFIAEGQGDALQKQIEEAREKLIEIVKTVKQINIDNFLPNVTLKVDEPKSGKTWAVESFYMVPSIAGNTLLTKIQQDIRTTQANINDAFLASIGRDDHKFDNLIAVVRVTTGKSAVAVGEKFEAEILLAAYDSKQEPKIFLGEQELEVKDGKAVFVGNTSQQMSFDKPGRIVVVNKSTGEETEYKFDLAYDVFTAPAIISADAMNVLYVGLDNPISISVPGFRPTDISAGISQGSLPSKSPGKYTARVPDQRGLRETAISVSVRLPDGSSKSMGRQVFRIMRVPAPTPSYGASQGGDITPGAARTVNFVSVRLENFPFDLRYSVTKFRMIYQPARGAAQVMEATSANLTQQMKNVTGNLQRGDKILIVNIFAQAAGISARQIPGSIVLDVQ